AGARREIADYGGSTRRRGAPATARDDALLCPDKTRRERRTRHFLSPPSGIISGPAGSAWTGAKHSRLTGLPDYQRCWRGARPPTAGVSGHGAGHDLARGHGRATFGLRRAARGLERLQEGIPFRPINTRPGGGICASIAEMAAYMRFHLDPV